MAKDKKITAFPKKHVLVRKGFISEKGIKKLDPGLVDSILMPLLKGKKKNMGGAVMKNRGGTFKGTY